MSGKHRDPEQTHADGAGNYVGKHRHVEPVRMTWTAGNPCICRLWDTEGILDPECPKHNWDRLEGETDG